MGLEQEVKVCWELKSLQSQSQSHCGFHGLRGRGLHGLHFVILGVAASPVPRDRLSSQSHSGSFTHVRCSAESHRPISSVSSETDTFDPFQSSSSYERSAVYSIKREAQVVGDCISSRSQLARSSRITSSQRTLSTRVSDDFSVLLQYLPLNFSTISIRLSCLA